MERTNSKTDSPDRVPAGKIQATDRTGRIKNPARETRTNRDNKIIAANRRGRMAKRSRDKTGRGRRPHRPKSRQMA